MSVNRIAITQMWDKYQLPDSKRRHMMLVSRVAVFFARELAGVGIAIDTDLVEKAALLHDIDKNIPKRPDEHHPDAGVRVLEEEGLHDVAALVATHPLHTILDPATAPSTWEAKILFLADKMVKYDIITVDKRFALWEKENLDANARRILTESYPKVKKLEQKILQIIGVSAEKVAELAGSRYT